MQVNLESCWKGNSIFFSQIAAKMGVCVKVVRWSINSFKNEKKSYLSLRLKSFTPIGSSIKAIFSDLFFFSFPLFPRFSARRQTFRKPSSKLSRSSVYYSFDGDAIADIPEENNEACVEMKSLDQR